MCKKQIPMTALLLFVIVSPGVFSEQSRKIRVVIPRAIRSERDSKECLAAAEIEAKEIEKKTNISPADKPERLSDCYAIIDYRRKGYTKCYPGGVRVQFQKTIRRGLCYVFSPEFAHPATLISIDNETSISVVSHGEDRLEAVRVSLVRKNELEPFRREPGGWNEVQSPDELERFCLRLFEDYRLLSR
jgi:hypothetical protein